MPPNITAAVAQICTGQDLDDNLRRARAQIARAVDLGAQLVVLPENFAYIRALKDKVALAETLCVEEPGPIRGAMAAAAREHHVHVLLGGMPVRSPEAGRFYNTAVLLDPEGAIAASYRKIHLFDVRIPDGAMFTESEYVVAGDDPVVAPILGSTLGLSICYDLRFPELYRRLVELGASILAVPAAFTLHTGKDHWLPLLRARAIENQCYVLAANQHGRHTPERTSFGKSCIVDPWGAIIAQVPDRDGVAVAELDMAYLEKVRQELPCLGHRRM